jgi:hypothetical protein
VNLVTLVPDFAGEEEAAGQVSDPRQPGRVLHIRTRYLRGVDAAVHRLTIAGGALRKAQTGDPFVSHGMRASPPGLGEATPAGRALYVLDDVGQLFAADAATQSIGASELAAARAGDAAEVHVPDVLELLQHSSLVAGGPVRCAGELATDERGRLRLLSSRSERYRSGPAHLVDLLSCLASAGVPLVGVCVEVGGTLQHDAAAFLAAGGAPIAFRGLY